MDYNALKQEIETDPKALGYSGLGDQEIADKLNEVGGSSETKIKTSVATGDVLKALVFSEVEALTTKQIQILDLFTFGDNIDPSDTNIKELFKGLFGAGTTTRSNLLALAEEPCSRGEKLGFGTVMHWDVARAEAL